MNVTPRQLIGDLEKVTRELVAAGDAELDGIEHLLHLRSTVLAGIAACDPHTFTPDDLATLRDAALDGQAAIEKFTLLCRKTAGDWHRLNRLHDSVAEPVDTSVSLQG
jgi:hypothetical protein